MIRLDKLLADMGFGTRSEVRGLIRGGKAAVDGEAVKDPGVRINPAESVVTVDGKTVQYRQYVYYMMNKPAGVLSATRDYNQRTVLDLLAEDGVLRAGELSPAGRLDKDAEGLILLTNDGDLIHRIISPSHGTEKVYYAEYSGTLPADARERMAAGMDIPAEEGEHNTKAAGAFVSAPAVLVLPGDPDWPGREEGLSEFPDVTEAGAAACAAVTVTEGRYHQVKRMFRALGCEVTYLRRIRMGELRLDGSLAPGSYRPLTEEEIVLLRAIG